MMSSLFLAFLNARTGRELPMAAVLAALLFSAAPAHGTENASLAIKVDQVGYPLNGPKVALVSCPR